MSRKYAPLQAIFINSSKCVTPLSKGAYKSLSLACPIA
jgi:hypothetical protein